MSLEVRRLAWLSGSCDACLHIHTDAHAPPHPDRFYVYCKRPCNQMRPGKLRVRCSLCKDGGFVLQRVWLTAHICVFVKCDVLRCYGFRDPKAGKTFLPHANCRASAVWTAAKDGLRYIRVWHACIRCLVTYRLATKEFFFKCAAHETLEEEECIALHMVRANTVGVDCLSCLGPKP